MKRNAPWAVLAIFTLWTTAALGQPAYSIKIKESTEGNVVLVNKISTTITKIKVSDAGGNVLADNSEAVKESRSFKETILKREAGKTPSKLLREYASATTSKNDEKKDSALNGLTVVIERKGAKYQFTTKDGAAVSEEAANALAKDFKQKSDEDAEFEKAVMPKNPVKVGESWKIDMAKPVAIFARSGGLEVFIDKSKGTGTLIKAYKKDGKQFGEMKFAMVMPVKSTGQGKEAMIFSDGAKIIVELTLDACIDGSSDTHTSKMSMSMSGNATVPNSPGVTVQLAVTMEGTQYQQEAKK